MAQKYLQSCYKFIIQPNILKRPIKNNLRCITRCFASDIDLTARNIDEIKPSVIDYDVTRSKEDWECVKRVLPPAIVPKPIPRTSYKTHWRPQTAKPGEEKYFVERNRNHMVPLYFTSTHRGMRKITELHKIHGDIYKLNDDLVNEIKKSTNDEVATQVNEMVGCISIKGDYFRIVHTFLTNKRF